MSSPDAVSKGWARNNPAKLVANETQYSVLPCGTVVLMSLPSWERKAEAVHRELYAGTTCILEAASRACMLLHSLTSPPPPPRLQALGPA